MGAEGAPQAAIIIYYSLKLNASLDPEVLANFLQDIESPAEVRR